MKIILILMCLLWIAACAEPSEVIIQILYKPKECKEVGQHGDTMHMQYLGRFFDENRKTFDSSYNRNNVPFSYQLGVGGVIEGYQHGTKEMCLNERRRLIVPSKYAYGSRGTGNIPGHATLMFDIHLVQINDEAPAWPVPIEATEKLTATGNQDCKYPVKVGDVVEIQYVGSLADGSVFDNSSETGSLKFVVGSHQIISGIDEGVVSFCKSSIVEMELPPGKAYGERWEGPVPQYSFVYYNVTIVDHAVSDLIPEGDDKMSCENLVGPEMCKLSYEIVAGDYVEMFYKVRDGNKVPVGESTIRYPVGRQAFVPGWDAAIIGSCVGQHKLCWIPASLAHKAGTSLFMAPPEKGFWVELKVQKVLLTLDGDRDEIDLQELDKVDDSKDKTVQVKEDPSLPTPSVTNSIHAEL